MKEFDIEQFKNGDVVRLRSKWWKPEHEAKLFQIERGIIKPIGKENHANWPVEPLYLIESFPFNP